MTIRLLAACIATATVVALPARASAGDLRFFFRGAVGVGYGGFVSMGEGPAISIHGPGALGNFALGLRLAHGFAVHIDACALALVSPTVTVNNVDRVSPTAADSTTTLSIIGAGVTWRHRSNFWASLSGGAAIVGVEIPGARCVNRTTNMEFDCSFALTEVGAGANVLVGRDWPLAYAWRIGLAAHTAFAVVPDQAVAGVQPILVVAGGGVSLIITAQ